MKIVVDKASFHAASRILNRSPMARLAKHQRRAERVKRGTFRKHWALRMARWQAGGRARMLRPVR